ncbi:molybdenum cofactor guanylyltransferase [Cohnella kolymensis]|uniref:molybdenum cofactor guanylyltransferase n=1 Tax=Cohnella kolymensis TaxID=1590652 RepID=UPI0006981C68|nr:molybdenum cofactor guanylyltransferase [Cohnella kolymensis]
MSSSTITGAILAGGPNKFMSGTLKPLLPFDGGTLIEHQIRIMRELCGEIIVVTNTPKPFFDVLDRSVRLITDYFPDCGPLGGIHAALHLARNPLVWVAGCDMPFLSTEAARRLVENRTEHNRAFVPTIGNRPLPLHGIYDKRCAADAANLLSTGEKRLEAFLNKAGYLGISADSWREEQSIGDFAFTIRSQEDYERAEERLSRILHTR